MGERLKTWKKKLTKENMAIMALLGILLMVIAIPVKKTETQKDQTAAPENKSTASGTQETEEEDNTGGYAGELEERLESLLASMEGVGNVKVMVTLDSSREQVVEKDIPSTMDTTKETDSTGGSRDVINSRQEETTVYVTDSAGIKTHYVSKISEPSIDGVTRVAKGGGNGVIQNSITE